MKKASYFIMFSSLFITSCGYIDDEDNNFYKSSNEIIFYEPSGKNFLTLNSRITTHVSSDNYISALSLFEIFQNLRSSMVLVIRHKEKKDSEGILRPGKTPSGSSKLASSNLLVTASHVTTSMFWCPDVIDRAFVSGARDWVYDEENFEYDETTPYSSEVYPPNSPSNFTIAIKDDWMFRFRLKALGLENWAHHNINYTTNPPDNSDFDVIPDNFEGWLIEVVNDWSSVGKDIAIVKTLPKVINDNVLDLPPNNLNEFKVSGPGMFYDYDIIGCSNCSKNTTKPLNINDILNTYHINRPMISDYFNPSPNPQYGGSASLQKMVNIREETSVLDERITSTETQGIYSQPQQYSDVCEGSSMSEPSSFPPIYNLSTEALVDSREGSSGGSVYVAASNHHSKVGLWVGVVSASGGPSDTDSSFYDLSTSEEDEFNFVEFDSNIEEDIINNTGNRGAPFFGDPSGGWPPGITPVDDCIAQQPISERANCLDVFLNVATYVEPDEWHCAGNECPSSTPTSAPTDRKKDEFFDLSCQQYDYSLRITREDIGVGILGGVYLSGGVTTVGNQILPGQVELCSTSPMREVPRDPENNTAQHKLGQIGIVCAPTSYADWSVNWDFIYSKFVVRLDDCIVSHWDDLVAFFNQNNFVASISNVMTKTMAFHNIGQDDSFDIDGYDVLGGQASPLPLQMCRPGYVLQGLHVNVSNDRSDIAGIRGLFCVAKPSYSVNDTYCNNNANRYSYPCYIPLYSPERHGFLYNKEEPMYLTQAVGDVRSTNVGVTPIEMICSGGRFLKEMRVSSNKFGSTQFIEIGCRGF